MKGEFNTWFLTGAITTMMVILAALQIMPDKLHVVFSALVFGAMLGWGMAKWHG